MNEPPRKITPDGDVLQIRKIGNSLGLILSKDLLARLNLKEGDKLHVVEQTERDFTLSKNDLKHARAMQIARRMTVEYRDTFRELAK